MRILILEDDRNLNQIVYDFLKRNGYDVISCMDAQRGFEILNQEFVDLIISDIMMPGMDGFEFAEAVRRNNEDIPILFMSALDDLPSKQRGFRIGIDDYMVKPIVLEELLLRIQALLRRAKTIHDQKIEIGDFVMDANATAAFRGGKEIELTTREFQILYRLLSSPNKTFSRAQLMDEFWGIDSDASLRAVDVYITRIRDKIGDNDFYIKTVRGLGYKAVPEHE